MVYESDHHAIHKLVASDVVVEFVARAATGGIVAVRSDLRGHVSID